MMLLCANSTVLPFNPALAPPEGWVLVLALDPNPIDPRRIGVTGLLVAASVLNPPPPGPNVLTAN